MKYRVHHATAMFLILFVVVLPAITAAQPASKSIFPETPRGQVAAAWFEIFNSGDADRMDDFQKQRFSDGLLTRIDADARREMYLSSYTDMQALRPEQLLEDIPDRIGVLFQTQSGNWMEVRFHFEPGSDKIAGLMLRESLPPGDFPPPGPLTEAQAIKGIEEKLARATEEDAFSGTVLVAGNGKEVFSRACGLASREFSVPNRIDTKFNLGSINKIFTKVAIAQLLQEGRLSLDDPLGKFLPDYPNEAAARTVTVRHLVNMSSGVGDFFGEKFDATPKDRLRQNVDFLPLFASEPLAFAPGTNRQYSNGGFVLLGVIVEKASGRNYYDYIREHVYEPAGMRNTDSYEADAIVSNLASGYTRMDAQGGEGPLHSNIYTRPARGSSAGGGYSTVSDLLKFTTALGSNILLRPEYSDWVQGGPEPGSKEAGASTQSPHGMAFAGGAPGINAFVETGLPGGYTVIVMSNLDPPAAEKASNLIRQWLSKVE